MKRKDVNEVHNDDDVFDFTLSSPALKIRRLDAEMGPIIDHDETMNPLLSEQLNGTSPIAVVEPVPENQERAIVLFNPNNDPRWLHLPRPLSMSPNSDFLSGFKNPILWSNETSSLVDYETPGQDDDSGQSDASLAVVPWAPQHPPNLQVNDPGIQISDMMDTDAAMDVENDCNFQQIPKNEWSATSVSQGLNPWQHHCMIEQPHINMSTPITWFGRDA
uniref:uncharacterized protein LOC122596562 n=1 Tax=Erigeron canadensis TaxID=72917 RepID=UPI001CB972C6|nr:uncharacterized protein LOC122596562 [Erigeron canadensis]XP_043625104.1 uncharacterized protein LOC122596562 [Erigeron canadensis]